MPGKGLRCFIILQMNIEEAVAKSAESLTIFIMKEALFCNVNEEGAWRFIELVKPYTPIKKRVKKLIQIYKVIFTKLNEYLRGALCRKLKLFCGYCCSQK